MFSILFAIDIVLAKAFFPPSLAGLYAGVASLGRIMFFGASILTWILLANLTTHDHAKSRSVLRYYLSLIAGCGLVGVALFWFFGDFIVRISLGHAYASLSPQLWLAGLNQLIAALLYAYTLYLLVLRKQGPALLALLCCGLAMVFAFFHPNTPRSLLVALISGQLAGYCLFVVVVSGRKLIRPTS
jgi:O-antigen/teichoic acid export membrane protein